MPSDTMVYDRTGQVLLADLHRPGTSTTGPRAPRWAATCPRRPSRSGTLTTSGSPPWGTCASDALDWGSSALNWGSSQWSIWGGPEAWSGLESGVSAAGPGVSGGFGQVGGGLKAGVSAAWPGIAGGAGRVWSGIKNGSWSRSGAASARSGPGC